MYSDNSITYKKNIMIILLLEKFGATRRQKSAVTRIYSVDVWKKVQISYSYKLTFDEHGDVYLVVLLRKFF